VDREVEAPARSQLRDPGQPAGLDPSAVVPLPTWPNDVDVASTLYQP